MLLVVEERKKEARKRAAPVTFQRTGTQRSEHLASSTRIILPLVKWYSKNNSSYLRLVFFFFFNSDMHINVHILFN
jgi:hypothetical protein